MENGVIKQLVCLSSNINMIFVDGRNIDEQ